MPGGSRIAAAVALAAAVLAGCSATSSTDTGAPLTPSTTTVAPEAAAAVGPNVVPTRVAVPSIGAASSLQAVALNTDGTMQTPPVSQPQQAAWFRYSPIPGNIGPADIVGHINGGGHPGVFLHLAEVKPGAEVDVDRSDGTTAVFTVRKVDVVAKSAFPTSAVYSNTANAQLRVISCGGDLDRSAHSYLSNVIVYADLVGAHRTNG